jgi:hypothetical protein
MNRFRGRFQSFSVVFAVVSRSFLEKIREFQRKTENIGEIFPFSFLFFPFHYTFFPQTTPFLCSKTYFMQILLKFLAFFLAVPNILRTFANANKTIVNYPAGRPLSPMASSRRLFLCL